MQFPYVAAVSGMMMREKTATNFYMGAFYAESLLLAETGSVTGAIQISGTDQVSQIPFFVAATDYTLIGEELYAASASLSQEPQLMGPLKAQDYAKVIGAILAGAALLTSSLGRDRDALPHRVETDEEGTPDLPRLHHGPRDGGPVFRSPPGVRVRLHLRQRLHHRDRDPRHLPIGIWSPEHERAQGPLRQERALLYRS